MCLVYNARNNQWYSESATLLSHTSVEWRLLLAPVRHVNCVGVVLVRRPHHHSGIAPYASPAGRTSSRPANATRWVNRPYSVAEGIDAAFRYYSICSCTPISSMLMIIPKETSMPLGAPQHSSSSTTQILLRTVLGNIETTVALVSFLEVVLRC